MALQADGVLVLVLAGRGEPGFAGVGVFDAPPEEVRQIIESDPGVQAGIFGCEIHEVGGFPSSGLPA